MIRRHSKRGGIELGAGSTIHLHVQETTLQRDHDGVGAITGSQLDENALEMSLDCVF